VVIVMDKRKNKRLSSKLVTKISSNSLVSWGLLTDVSENGLFIKSNRDFTMGEVIDIELFMPDNNNSLLKGVIMRRVDLPESHRKYGLGIELTEKDMVYRYFLKSLKLQTKTLSRTTEGIGENGQYEIRKID
jgi:Tfp pilus assembly protein PilZ